MSQFGALPALPVQTQVGATTFAVASRPRPRRLTRVLVGGGPSTVYELRHLDGSPSSSCMTLQQESGGPCHRTTDMAFHQFAGIWRRWGIFREGAQGRSARSLLQTAGLWDQPNQGALANLVGQELWDCVGVGKTAWDLVDLGGKRAAADAIRLPPFPAKWQS